MTKETSKKQYFDSEKYDVLENKVMILVFKKTFWNKNLIYWKGFNKDYFKWEDDIEAKMCIIIERKNPLDKSKMGGKE